VTGGAPHDGRPRGIRLVDRRLVIDAPPSRVYRLLTDAERFVKWMAPEAVLEPRPGGTITWRHANGDRCGGTFVELVPERRIVFTYGWERADVAIPPGSTTVEITLSPHGHGTELPIPLPCNASRQLTNSGRCHDDARPVVAGAGGSRTSGRRRRARTRR